MKKYASIILKVAALTVGFGFGTTATATPVIWTLDYLNTPTFSLAGTFGYDADTNIFFDVNVVGTDLGGINILDTTYLFTDNTFGSPSSSTNFTFLDTLAADRTGTKFIRASLSTALTNAGGVISLLVTDGSDIFPSRCLNSTCTSWAGYSVSGPPIAANGTLTGIASEVPAPATLALFGLGLAGLGWSRRKKA